MSASVSRYVGPPSDLKPNPTVIRSFLDFWFSGCDGNIEIAWIDPETKKLNQTAHFDVRDPRLEQLACDVNSIAGQNCYFTPSIVSTSHGRAADKDFICAPGVWLDQDDVKHINYANDIDHEFYPSTVVHTGRVPELRRSLWFKFDEPTFDPNLVRETNKKLVGFYQGDSSAVNPARLMRLPGTVSWPYKAGREPECTTWDHPSDGRRSSHPISLAASIPTPSPQMIAQKERGSAPTVNELIDKIQAGDNWHNNLVQLIGHWISYGRTDREIMVWAPEFTLPGYSEAETIAEMQGATDSGRLKWNRPEIDAQATTRLQDAIAAFAGAPALPPTLPGEEQGEEFFELLSLGELSDRHGKKPEMLIDGYLTRGSTTMITGLPGTGKSPVVQHMCVCVAMGVPWAGIPTVRGNVLYVAAESHSQTAMNLANLLVYEVENLWGCPGVVDVQQAIEFVGEAILTLTSGFFLETDVDKLISTIDRERATGGRWEGTDGPDIIALDTLRAMSVGSVNNDEDMVAVQIQIAKLKRRYERSCQVLLNHSPKGDPEGSLGSNRLDAFSEVIVNITHKKPNANADDETVLKRPQRIGPNAEGVSMSPLAISVQRNKTWTVPAAMRATLVVKGNTLTVIYGAASIAAERPHAGDNVADSPFIVDGPKNSEAKAKTKAPRIRTVKIPENIQKICDSATSKPEWAQRVLEASGIEFTAADMASIAYTADMLLFMPDTDLPTALGIILRDLSENGKIERSGEGRGTKYRRAGQSV